MTLYAQGEEESKRTAQDHLGELFASNSEAIKTIPAIPELA